MSNTTNSFSTIASPQAKGSIQFSTSGKARQGTPKGAILAQTNVEEEVVTRTRTPSAYDSTPKNQTISESLIFSTGEQDLKSKYLNPFSALKFKEKDHKDIQPRKYSNNGGNDLSKHFFSPLLVTSTEGINQSLIFTSSSSTMIPTEQDVGPPSPDFKPKRNLFLSKYKSIPKIGFHCHCKEDFIIGKKLGKGNFGKVYLAQHKILGFIFALKVISKQVIKEKNMEKQIVWQAAINMSLSHPNIIQMYGMFDDSQNIYFIEELMTDGHLFNQMKQSKRLSEDQVIPITKSVLEGVEYMHRMSIIHRDLKPENILMVMGMYKIGDFGWAIYTPDLLRDTFCGTPLYMSPEILKGEKYDSGVDIWSLGILIFQMLVGKPPFKISTPQELSKIITQQIKFPEHVNLSDSAKDFVLKLLERNSDLREDLDTLLAHPFIKDYKNEISPQFNDIML